MRLVPLTDEEIVQDIEELEYDIKVYEGGNGDPESGYYRRKKERLEKLQACLKGEGVGKQLELALKETAKNKRWYHTDYIRMLDNTFIEEAMEKLNSYLGE